MHGRNHSEETRKKMSAARKGWKPSEETREKWKRSNPIAPMEGKKHSEETRERMSRAAKELVRSPEHCAAISRAKMGKPAPNKGVRKVGSVRWKNEMKKMARANEVQAPADFL